MNVTSIQFLLILIFFALIPFLGKGQKITIQRKFENDECTMGYVFVNDSAVCYSLERAELANKKNVSRIPAGTYKAFIRTDKKNGWRIELIDVFERKNVQIHLGNYPFQTTGCTLVGSIANLENCTVEHSSAALEKLKSMLARINSGLDLNSNSTQQYNITVTFK